MAQPAAVGAWRRGEGHAASDYAVNVHARSDRDEAAV
jgi:hypothetical protein